jgi:outer membrane immunogenic protein
MRILAFTGGFALAVLLCAPVAAANPIAIPTSGPDTLSIPVHDEGVFDWSGFYAGVFGTAATSTSDGADFGGGFSLGVNAQFDFILTGAEVTVRGLSDASDLDIDGQLLGRAGILVADDLALYGTAGFGLDFGGASDGAVILGAGAEYALNDTVSLRAQYQHEFSLSGSPSADTFSFGANFHF